MQWTGLFKAEENHIGCQNCNDDQYRSKLELKGKQQSECLYATHDDCLPWGNGFVCESQGQPGSMKCRASHLYGLFGVYWGNKFADAVREPHFVGVHGSQH